MRGARREMLQQQRMEWLAAEGVPLAAMGWYCFGESQPWGSVVWEEKNGSPAQRLDLTGYEQQRNLFLPDTLCEQAALEVDFLHAGNSSLITQAPLTFWVPGQVTTAFMGLMNVRNNVSCLYNGNNLVVQTSLGLSPSTRMQLRLERRGQTTRMFCNGTLLASATNPIANNQRHIMMSKFPADAPNELGMVMYQPNTSGTQSLWIYRVLWEELC